MKYQLFLVLDHGDVLDDLFKTLSRNGFNATVMGARSIKHLLEDEESEHVNFLSISRLDQHLERESTTCFFIVDEFKLEELKSLIREVTNNFKKIKGAMYSIKLEDYEGTF